MTKTINRVEGIDLAKSVAIFFVISVHFFLYNGFYETPMQGGAMFIATLLRWLFYTCVPLFILSTGYLMRKKELSKEYYKPLLKIIITYFIISAISIIVRKYYLQDELTWLKAIGGIAGFTTNPYSWYVNMYIGLFLLIPFLNVLYNNLQTQRKKLVLILSFVLLTGFSQVYIVGRLIPNWWVPIYPLTYYFIGAYLSEYPIKLKKWYLVLLAFFSLFSKTLLSYYLSSKENISFSEFHIGHGALPIMIAATCFFLLLYDIRLRNNVLNLALTTISKLTLEIYLISYLVDRAVYPHFKKIFSTSTDMLPYYGIIVPSIFLMSIVGAMIVNFIQRKFFAPATARFFRMVCR